MEKDVEEVLKLTHLVCPECMKLTTVDDDKARTILDPFNSIIYGINITCEHCGKKSFINYMDKPPLFNLAPLSGAVQERGVV